MATAPLAVDSDCVDAETVTLLLEEEDVAVDGSVEVEVSFLLFLVEMFCLDESPELLLEELDCDEVSIFFLIDFLDITATE